MMTGTVLFRILRFVALGGWSTVMVVVQYICGFIILYFLVKAAWPDTRKQQAEAARKQQADADDKHRELLATIAKLERQITAPVAAPIPLYHAFHGFEEWQPAHGVNPNETVVKSNAEPPPASRPPVSVICAGVVDGMSYTLYSDGSIEAQLPKGTLRFGSVNELRDYIEQSA